MVDQAPARSPYDRSRGSAPIVQDPRIRRGNSIGGRLADHPGRSVGAQQAAWQDDPRYNGDVNDTQIRRDRTVWFPSDQRSGVGTATVDWTAAGPPRPELHVRNVTYRLMAGNSQSRAFADPRDPNIGLHTITLTKPRGNIERYKAGSSAMRPGRTDRLSPARYTGQSYSQTTLEQGRRR